MKKKTTHSYEYLSFPLYFLMTLCILILSIGTTAAQKKLFFSLGKIKQRITKLYSRDVTEQDFTEIANEPGVSRHEVNEMNCRLAEPDLSLNNPISNSENNDSELIEFFT